MSKWEIVQLAELSSAKKYAFTGGPFGSSLVSSDYQPEGVPVIRGGNLPDHAKFSFDDLVFVSEHKADALRSNNAHPGDLIFTQRGTLGQVGLIPFTSTYKRFVISQSQMKLTINPEKVDALYLYYYFRLPSTVEQIKNFAMSSGIPHINLDILKKFKVYLPPLPIQRKIAAILSAYDDLIENNTRRIALMEKMAEEVYREWFVRLRFPGHAQVAVHQGVPERWEIKRLDEVANILMGQSPSSDFYNETGNGLPFHQGVGTYGTRFPQNQVYSTEAKRTAQKGDILFSVRAPVGRLNIANCNLIIGRGLAAVNHKSGLNSYLFYLLKNVFAVEDIIGNGSIFNSVGKDEFASMKVFYPEQELVQTFNSLASKIDTQIENLYTQIDALKITRDRLLARLLCGKLDVENLDIRFPPGMREMGQTHARP